MDISDVAEELGKLAFQTYKQQDHKRQVVEGANPKDLEGYVATEKGFRCWDPEIVTEAWYALSESERQVWRFTASAVSFKAIKLSSNHTALNAMQIESEKR